MLTIKPQPHSNQDAFNNVWQHFIVERNPRARDRSEKCRYRIFDDTGIAVNACAIGCQLPDNLYRVGGIEGLGVNAFFAQLETDFETIVEYFRDVDPSFLISLQRAHDQMRTSLKQALIALANAYHLTVPDGSHN